MAVCILCGIDTPVVEPGRGVASVGELSSWASEYRVVFPSPPYGDGPRLSGVGLCLINRKARENDVPSSYDARWDDKGRRFSDLCKVPSVQADLDYRGLDLLLHAHCCTLLEEIFRPRPVPVARLVELCRSWPKQHGLLNWGHDYGGFAQLHHANPWAELDIRSKSYIRQREDPLEIPELAEALRNARRDRPQEQTFDAKQIHEAMPNVFTRLPREILGCIMAYLPTDEVEALSRTCKGLKMYIPFEMEPSFWISRFQEPFEFGFVFEAQKCRDQLDLRSLYFGVVKAARESSGLEDRRLIWDVMLSPLSKLLSMRLSSGQTLQPPNEGRRKLRWKEVSGNLQQRDGRHSTNKFRRGCKRFYKQRTSMPPLRQVVVSTILIGDVSYVTGLRLVPNNGLEISLGYTSERDEPCPNVTDHTIDTTGIQGFIIALDSKGIQALQVILDVGQLSPWFGCPKGVLKTRRLADFESIAALEAGFDGFKMVSLAIAENSHISPVAAESLRDNALWFPDIPESHLQLNENFFVGVYSHNPTSEFEPLCYVIFRDSTNPRPLIKISEVRGSHIAAIDFHYATGDPIRLGRVDEKYNPHTTSFDINGTEGEVIESIKISPMNIEGSWNGEPGVPSAFEVFTNRGRSHRFLDQHAHEPAAPVAVAIPPGATITGLYCQWNSATHMTGLGVISEFID